MFGIVHEAKSIPSGELLLGCVTSLGKRTNTFAAIDRHRIGLLDFAETRCVLCARRSESNQLRENDKREAKRPGLSIGV